MPETPSDAEFENQLKRWLRDRGYTPDQVDAILDRVAVYDDEIVRNAFFDSVGTGSVDLEEIIAEALGGREVDEPRD